VTDLVQLPLSEPGVAEEFEPSNCLQHLEAYARFVDCALRTPGLAAVDVHRAMQLLSKTMMKVKTTPAVLNKTAAVRALASAMMSLAKRAAQVISAADSMQAHPAAEAAAAAAAAGGAGTDEAAVSRAAAWFPAATVKWCLWCWLQITSSMAADAACKVLPHARGTSTEGHGSSSASSSQRAVQLGSSQAAASAALLTVVLSRCAMQLVDAVQEAASQLLFHPIMTSPAGMAAWWHRACATSDAWQPRLALAGGQDESSVEASMLSWQRGLVTAAEDLVLALQRLGVASAAGDNSSSSDSSSSVHGSRSSSSSKQVRWSYLLRLQQSSPKWAAAVAAIHHKQPRFAQHDQSGSDQHAATSSSGLDCDDVALVQQQYDDALQLLRALVAAAPVTVGCSSLACQNLAGVRDTAAAESRCSRCKCCHYCSTACQVADWLLHKQVCRKLAASNARQPGV
jgi:hypothetical protein